MQELVEKLKQFIENSKPPSISVTLKEAKIGSSGINCELISEDELDDWIANMGKAISVGKVKKLKD